MKAGDVIRVSSAVPGTRGKRFVVSAIDAKGCVSARDPHTGGMRCFERAACHVDRRQTRSNEERRKAGAR